MTIDLVPLSKAAELTGYTEKALARKIERGQLVEGREWFKAPDGRKILSLSGFEKWLTSGYHKRPPASKSIAGASA